MMSEQSSFWIIKKIYFMMSRSLPSLLHKMPYLTFPAFIYEVSVTFFNVLW